MRRKDKVRVGIYLSYFVFIVVIGTASYFVSNVLDFALSLLALLLMFSPALIRKDFRADFPSLIDTLILVYLFLGTYLGSFKSFFEEIWWWDILLHLLMGINIALISFSIIFRLKEVKAHVQLSPFMIASFSFAISMAAGGIWEIIEYILDTFFGFELQQPHPDTMIDLIFVFIGGLVVSAGGYLYAKYPRANMIELMFSKEEIEILKEDHPEFKKEKGRMEL
ncbi:hypothetical protein [Methanosarcina sp. DH2]|uniref:hypothetical protein n=1 Tax=Methanosarcina sp. DH2 TaxID=2605639 RepID=UPI001E5351F3|nr:hypothetical protein [Methanosarcina sp. DH2]